MGNPLFWPMIAMAGLTFLVWLRMFQTRVGEMKRRRIHPQSVAQSAQMAQLVEDSRAADNFRNLFELPVLFYAAMLLCLQAGIDSVAILVLAWAFVALRALHSYIHCTYNRVMDRFKAYVLSGFVLWAIWGLLVWNWLG
ncbi:MAPEG family protein [Arenimonas sp. GDDSR-1]|uniref:MAPEG family protein n=1 Tax=Arenimonas sp. GDDSR-1 TaxID=2950125 RepID=UPI002620342D|nr:MAPEG family protein [Arenimonas sp. GDDSR-1]